MESACSQEGKFPKIIVEPYKGHEPGPRSYLVVESRFG
ncbi:hypothetical protein C7S15_5536 [Burkholderia cepacia]|nr:hypothetical protein [Burkholderia cepacia]